MTNPIPPDDQWDPQELFRRLHGLVENFPKMVHEQVGAVREEAATTLELTQELERRVTEDIDALVGWLEKVTMAAYQVSIINVVQTAMLQLVFKAMVGAEPTDPEEAKRLYDGLVTLYGLSGDEWEDDAAMDDLRNRTFPPTLETEA